MKADGLLTVTMKEAKEEREEKEAHHNTRIVNHLKTTSKRVFPHIFVFNSSDCDTNKIINFFDTPIFLWTQPHLT